MTGVSDKSLNMLATRVGRQLLASGQRVTAAESCTGGFIAKTLTDVPGSSQWFDMGFVTYANEAKTVLLGVAPGLLGRHGAVSREVAIAMARGALRRARAQVAVAVSGVAGPGGGTVAKPVGMVWIAWCCRVGRTVTVRTTCFRFRGGRDVVRRAAVAAALRGLLSTNSRRGA
jgi:nicotinamide-nucleotide amidase